MLYISTEVAARLLLCRAEILGNKAQSQVVREPGNSIGLFNPISAPEFAFLGYLQHILSQGSPSPRTGRLSPQPAPTLPALGDGPLPLQGWMLRGALKRSGAYAGSPGNAALPVLETTIFRGRECSGTPASGPPAGPLDQVGGGRGGVSGGGSRPCGTGVPGSRRSLPCLTHRRRQGAPRPLGCACEGGVGAGAALIGCRGPGWARGAAS